MTLSSALSLVTSNVDRLTALGSWPGFYDGKGSLVGRLPLNGTTNAPGFDAGIACALGMIPEEVQQLSASLHGPSYTLEAVEQVRREAVDMSPNSPTCWWLAACSLCKEGGVDEALFLQQIEAFSLLAADPIARRAAAIAEFSAMSTKFKLVDGIPFAIQDGGLQGAYIAGYDWAIQYMEGYAIFFIGTFRPSLGLENFEFSAKVDEKGRRMSGPVHGNQQFIKFSNFGELARAIEIVRAHLG